jgi:NAD(P)-dependent dehydrogenase (short-subunit alcohol dehydrogenase family)
MFALEGARGITITYLPEEEEDAKEAARDIENAGAKAVIVKCDLMEEADCKKVVDEHVKAFGTLHVLVNNASKQMSVSFLLAFPDMTADGADKLVSARSSPRLILVMSRALSSRIYTRYIVFSVALAMNTPLTPRSVLRRHQICSPSHEAWVKHYQHYVCPYYVCFNQTHAHLSA